MRKLFPDFPGIRLLRVEMRYLAFALLFLSGVARAEISILSAGPALDDLLTTTVKKVITTYTAFLRDELGLELQKNVDIIICTSEESYAGVLASNGSKNADRDAKWSGAMTFPDKHKMVIKVLPQTDIRETNRKIAHEITHILQNELAGKNSLLAGPWLNEGMADFFAATVSQKMGAQSIDSWKLQTANDLHYADNYPMPQDLVNLNIATWLDISNKTNTSTYHMADLMMIYMYEQKGPAFFGELATYYHCLRDSTLERICFSENFGISHEKFLAQTQLWVTGVLAQSGGIEIIANGQDDIAKELGNTHAVLQALMKERLGKKLPVRLRIYLSKGQEEMAGQLLKEAGTLKEDTVKQTQVLPWNLSGSMIFIDTARANTPLKRAEIISLVESLFYFDPYTANLSHVYWLYPGLGGLMSAQLLEKLGLRSSAQNTLLRKDLLSKARNGLPVLSELATHDSWGNAKKKYGYEVVKQQATEAVYSLLQKKGETNLGKWLVADKESKGSADAFTQSFGETADTFYGEWQLSADLK